MNPRETTLFRLNNTARIEGPRHTIQHLSPRTMRLERELGDTALHESEHAVPALVEGIEVEELSVVPDEAKGSLGHVKMNRFSAVATAAPAAHNRGGTSHDLQQLRTRGFNVQSAMHKAREVLAPRKMSVLALATLATKRGTLTSSEIRDVFNDTEHARVVVIDTKTGAHTTLSGPHIPVEKFVS